MRFLAVTLLLPTQLPDHPSNLRLRTANRSGRMGGMNALDGRMVVVPAAAVDDLAELARLGADRLEQLDPALSSSLRGSAAQVRANAVLEP